MSIDLVILGLMFLGSGFFNLYVNYKIRNYVKIVKAKMK